MMAKNILFLLILISALGLFLACGCTDDNTTGTPTVETTGTPAVETTGTGSVAEEGDTVYVQYKGTLNDGTIFDESETGDPLVFTLGENSMITGFEDAVYGMTVGETKTIHLTPDQAYGEYNPENTLNISRDQIPEDVELYEGAQLVMAGADGSVFQVTVLSVSNDTVVLDGNSPMAGKELNFEITLEKIDKAN
jgi:FKBP-type peptidyl-prolyl cis-trans isomerase 2